MSITIHLTKPRDPKSRAEQAIDLLRANGFDEFADELYARHSDDCGSIPLESISIGGGLWRMAEQGGFYGYVWRPEEMGVTKASQMAVHLRRAIAWMESHRGDAPMFSGMGGPGSHAELLQSLREYLAACEEFPDADIEVSR